MNIKIVRNLNLVLDILNSFEYFNEEKEKEFKKAIEKWLKYYYKKGKIINN